MIFGLSEQVQFLTDMSETAVQAEKIVERPLCKKCSRRKATQDDQLCDSCRFMSVISGMVKTDNQ
jgi:hypothetical protein